VDATLYGDLVQKITTMEQHNQDLTARTEKAEHEKRDLEENLARMTALVFKGQLERQQVAHNAELESLRQEAVEATRHSDAARTKEWQSVLQTAVEYERQLDESHKGEVESLRQDLLAAHQKELASLRVKTTAVGNEFTKEANGSPLSVRPWPPSGNRTFPPPPNGFPPTQPAEKSCCGSAFSVTSGSTDCVSERSERLGEALRIWGNRLPESAHEENMQSHSFPDDGSSTPSNPAHDTCSTRGRSISPSSSLIITLTALISRLSHGDHTTSDR
jgi:hypothetical protein